MRYFFAFTVFLNGFFFLWQSLQTDLTPSTRTINNTVAQANVLPIQLLSERPDLKVEQKPAMANNQSEASPEQSNTPTN